MKTWLSLFTLCFVLFSCSEKKIDLSGDVPVKTSDFIAAFPILKLPFSVADTNINKSADTVTLGYKLLQQFFPDSVLSSLTPQPKKTIIHPVGIFEKEKENYLLLTMATQKKSTKLVVFVTDKKYKFLSAKEILATGLDETYIHSVSINREPTFLISREKSGKDNQLLFTRIGWVYTRSAGFMVVVNDSNEGAIKSTIINPIDTLARTFKYSGDYGNDRKNFISIRDGKKPGVYLFFIHFEKEEGTCIGELKGEMKMNNPSTALYKGNGDPCIIDFSFEGNQISLKEQGSCGNHRGIRCFFDDTFYKKKEPKNKKKN